MVADILNKLENDIESLSIIPSSGGVYEVWKDGTLVFSKKQDGRFPESNDEVIRLLG